MSALTDDCASLGNAANPGVNCSFFGLPRCPTLASSVTPNHRVNCADLVDLPLCTELNRNGSSVWAGKNCVKECSDPSFVNPNGSASPALVRGVDYAIFNQHCVRFCDSPENGFTQTLAEGSNCVARRCHQLPDGVDPTPSNCTNLSCKLLTTDELSANKFDFTPPANYDPDSPNAARPKKYCEGDNLKCYEFSQEKLRYVGNGNRIRAVNPICVRHNCRSTAPSCGVDEITNYIESRSASYVAEYRQRVNSGEDLNNPYYCNPISCKPILISQYRCEPQNSDNPTTPNIVCDLSGGGSNCDSDGFCKATLDCNRTSDDENGNGVISDSERARGIARRNACMSSVENEDGTIGTAQDVTDAWFYRPKPFEGKATKWSDNDEGDDDSGILRNFSSDLCYDKWDFLHKWGTNTVVFGWAHSLNLPDHTRSPGMCGVNKIGDQGLGYGYLCGTHGNFYSKVSDDVAYHKGYVVTNFTEGDAIHQVTVCVRYVNTLHPWDGGSESCGRRQCAVSCGMSLCSSQQCGFDVCRTLTVKDSSPQDCMMKSDVFNGNPDKDCMARLGGGASVDSYLRVRAVKYDNKICTFLDVKGQLAYKRNFLNGSERISDPLPGGGTKYTCLSGQISSDNASCVGGKDSHDDKGLADKWRVNLHIPYIQDNQPNLDGYIDRDGRFFAAQNCIKAPLRISPPIFPNVGTANNATTLFTPPIFIDNVRSKRGGSRVYGADGGLGVTDFNYPEIEVKFGLKSQILSLGLGLTGNESSNPAPDPLASALMDSGIKGLEYKVNVFVKKEFNESGAPIFCLYERINNSSGNPITPARRGCVRRAFPDIDNSKAKFINPLLDLKTVAISRVAISNQINNSKLSLRYCSGANCTNSLEFQNPDADNLVCKSDVEGYKICSKREKCSELNVECVQNEVNYQNARNSGQSTIAFEQYRRYCTNLLLSCNAKRGINDASASLLDQNPSQSAVNARLYGWFNEICIAKGFESKIKNIVAFARVGSNKGKCVVSAMSPYLTDGNPATNCDSGGKAPNCLCEEPDPDLTDLDYSNVGQEVRAQTYREAGLCIDMPQPQLCPAIRYNLTPGANDDSDYVLHSLNKQPNLDGSTNYENSAGVHLSHKYRSFGSASNPTIALKGHAEFPAVLVGTTNAIGDCKGYWKKVSQTVNPQMSCVYDSSGNAVWEENVRNQCIRYSCNAITTAGPDSNGVYQGFYSSGEVGENVGLANGYATWPLFTKTTDSLENVSATGCITGFRKAEDENHPVEILKDRDGFIVGYSGGLTPARQCNQIGNYLPTIANRCVRISCPAIRPPENPQNPSDWQKWNAVGGATFKAIEASRSATIAQRNPESVQTGECNEALGFFQVGENSPPTLECDHLGNWRNLDNRCVTRCKEVSDLSLAADASNGFAYWNAQNNVPTNGELDGSMNTTLGAGGCVIKDGISYKRYPYPPLKDKYGQYFTLASLGTYRSDADPLDSAHRNIPMDVTQDTRAVKFPERVCKSVVLTGNLVNGVNKWEEPSSSCINKCPGFSPPDSKKNDPITADSFRYGDPRFGVGRTKHKISSEATSTEIILNWASTNFGEDAYISNCGEVSANHFEGEGRNNGCYVIRRHCGDDGRWEDPAPVCVAHGSADPDGQAGGRVGFAYYNTGTNKGLENSTPAGESSAIVTGSCIAGYWKTNRDQGSAPQRKCTYKDSAKNIDQVYWAMVSDKVDCELKKCAASTIRGDRFRTQDTAVEESNVNATQPITCLTGGATLGFDAQGNRLNLPSIRCQADGTWSTTIDNINNCRRGCVLNNAFSGDGTEHVDNVGSGNGLYFDRPAVIGDTNALVADEFELTNTFSDEAGGCDKYAKSYKCRDGAWLTPVRISRNEGQLNNRCNLSYVYNWTNNSWAEIGASENNGVVCNYNSRATGASQTTNQAGFGRLATCPAQSITGQTIQYQINVRDN